MSVIKKMVTLLRSSVREIGESVVDANATQIYEQEVIDAKQHLEQARVDLTAVMAKEMQAAREIARLRSEVTRFEGLALQALEKTQESLAEEVALQVATLETQLEQQVQAQATYSAQVQRLKNLIQAAEARIRDHERELSMARTTESVYKATQAISSNLVGGTSRLVSARQSLERIKQRHEDLADRMSAAEQLEDEMGAGALERRLAEAGIGAGVERKKAVMERLRARAAEKPQA